MTTQRSLAAIQFERNVVTRHDWNSFAPHRQRVSELILSAATRDSSLCVLGAGNGNDFDLSVLADRFESCKLVDLDDEALAHCLDRLPERARARVDVASGIDLSGILDSLERHSRDPQSSVDPLIERAGRPLIGLGQFDIVVSTCLLTQMIDSVLSAIGPNHPQFASLALALRDGHLSFLYDSIVPGGTAIVVSDFVSSDTLPELKLVSDEQLQSLLSRAIADRNFFTGVNPAAMARKLESIGSAQHTCHHQPWRWTMGDRVYAVCALTVNKGRSDVLGI